MAFHRRPVAGQTANRGQEVAVGVFGIQTAFHRPAVDLQIFLLERQRFTARHPDHLFHQIDPGDQLRHRMFHLQTGVHLKEIEVAVAINDEFHRAGAGIAHRFRQGAGLFAHRAARCLVQKRRRRFLDHLLVASLDRAFAFVQVDAIAVLVGQHLNFDVARLRHEFLDENPVIAK
ncbi:MAG: hypothetical protein ACD_54C00887G0001 [uncultured bacterium]|nr:MAG: hypothetical protein ACD_54C00887G0001 [uncultured bacterium]